MLDHVILQTPVVPNQPGRGASPWAPLVKKTMFTKNNRFRKRIVPRGRHVCVQQVQPQGVVPTGFACRVWLRPTEPLCFDSTQEGCR